MTEPTDAAVIAVRLAEELQHVRPDRRLSLAYRRRGGRLERLDRLERHRIWLPVARCPMNEPDSIPLTSQRSRSRIRGFWERRCRGTLRDGG